MYVGWGLKITNPALWRSCRCCGRLPSVLMVMILHFAHITEMVNKSPFAQLHALSDCTWQRASERLTSTQGYESGMMSGLKSCTLGLRLAPEEQALLFPVLCWRAPCGLGPVALSTPLKRTPLKHTPLKPSICDSEKLEMNNKTLWKLTVVISP